MLAAALDVLLESGIPGFTIDEVVARSGVAKTTIYRWWPSRQALLTDVIRCQLIPSATPNTGDLRADLIAYLAMFVGKPVDTPTGRLMPELCAAANRDPELAELRDSLLQDKRQPVLTLLELARGRGEIDADVDLDVVATLISGPIAYHRSMRGRVVELPFIEQVVDAALGYARAPHRAGV